MRTVLEVLESRITNTLLEKGTKGIGSNDQFRTRHLLSEMYIEKIPIGM